MGVGAKPGPRARGGPVEGILWEIETPICLEGGRAAPRVKIVLDLAERVNYNDWYGESSYAWDFAKRAWAEATVLVAGRA